MRFLIDENLPTELDELLRSLGHETLFVGRSVYRSAPDTAFWALAAEDNWILITKDLDFPLTNQERSLPGLILIRVPDTFTGPQIAGVVADFMATTAFGELEGQVTVVMPGRSRSRRLKSTS